MQRRLTVSSHALSLLVELCICSEVSLHLISNIGSQSIRQHFTAGACSCIEAGSF